MLTSLAYTRSVQSERLHQLGSRPTVFYPDGQHTLAFFTKCVCYPLGDLCAEEVNFLLRILKPNRSQQFNGTKAYEGERP